MPRLSVALDHTTKARLDWLKKTTEAPSLMSVIRRGAQLYEMLIAHNQAGGSIILRDKQGRERDVWILT